MSIETLTKGRSTRVRFYVVCILRITCIFLFVKTLEIPKRLFALLLVLLVEILLVGCLIVVDISTYLFLTLYPFCIHDTSHLAHFCTVFPPYFHTHPYSYTHTLLHFTIYSLAPIHRFYIGLCKFFLLY